MPGLGDDVEEEEDVVDDARCATERLWFRSEMTEDESDDPELWSWLLS